MKVLVSGKGGVGKTTVAATVARLLARRGLEVTAVDGDANPNLAVALGLGAGYAGVRSMRNVIGAPSHSHDIADLTREFGVRAPDGVRVMQTGEVNRPGEGCLCCGSHMTLRDVLARLPADGEHWVVADLEPGASDLIWAHPKPDDLLLLVTDGSVKSLEVAHLLRSVAEQFGLRRILVVANRWSAGVDRTREMLPGLDVFQVPEDEQLRLASRRDAAVLDAAAGSPAVAALSRLSDAVAGLAVAG